MDAGELGLAVLDGETNSKDLAAFERILRKHERLVLRVCLRMLGNLEDAQDAAQEVFLKLHRNFGRIHAGREVAPWLYRVAVNLCRDNLRRRKETVALEDLPLPAGKVDPEAALDTTRRAGLVAEGLKHLPEKQRAALVLRDVEGLSSREVAAILGSSETTVRSQISTARVKLKKYLDRVLRRPQ